MKNNYSYLFLSKRIEQSKKWIEVSKMQASENNSFSSGAKVYR